ncbi:hypothetical protein EYF80_025622 [Liparis tanakae]|uniref:Uncharacterized protein n=1 Tax=Liparis tanakae TaxID=230148 RepID=A0A4Z2HGT6_9TELE|nr:hypothetical protein EYF80_025622 [Liparis tanakae]
MAQSQRFTTPDLSHISPLPPPAYEDRQSPPYKCTVVTCSLHTNYVAPVKTADHDRDKNSDIVNRRSSFRTADERGGTVPPTDYHAGGKLRILVVELQKHKHVETLKTTSVFTNHTERKWMQ